MKGAETVYPQTSSISLAQRQIHHRPDHHNPLWDYFDHHQGRIIHKWQHYFDIYHNHFHRYRNTNVRILEIGLFKGGSLDMWKWYFGPHAKIIGVDIEPTAVRYAGPQVEIRIGDQADREFLKRLKKEVGTVDIVIDDGGHTMEQQIHTFEELYDIVADDGIFLVEDLHTSYWQEYGGGRRRSGTFIEVAKGLIDSLNAWHSKQPDFTPDRFTKSIGGLHFYDSMAVVEKTPRIGPPTDMQKGQFTL